ncbi:MAG: hypothetical protein DMF67_17155 [Acidobacteria bacterium]|nr:MAG: hypothetical protein DMF67_17155 [Acidobacteriota bacterium]
MLLGIRCAVAAGVALSQGVVVIEPGNQNKEETFMRMLHLTAYVFALALLICGAQRAQAQGVEHGWEMGGQFSAFSVTNGRANVTTVVPCIAPCALTTTTTTTEGRATDPGFGARVGYNVSRYFAVEAETNFFPRERGLSDNGFNGGRKTQGLFGVKVGRRYDKFGVFAKARPGFVRFSQGDFTSNGNACILSFPQPIGCFAPKGRTDFAFDAGGVLELYPSAHAFVRFDAGDTVLRSGDHLAPVTVPNRGTFAVGVGSNTTHNFQGSVGVGFRF